MAQKQVKDDGSMQTKRSSIWKRSKDKLRINIPIVLLMTKYAAGAYSSQSATMFKSVKGLYLLLFKRAGGAAFIHFVSSIP
jgi:hypothetical protein